MYPSIEFMGIRLKSYYVCALAAGILGMVLCMYNYRKRRLGAWRWSLPLLTVLFALVGARGLNALLNPQAYGSFFPVWRPAYRNLSLVGGLVLGLVPTVWVSWRKKVPLTGLLDDLVVPAGCGIMVLKLGCFLNGCCYGKTTESPLGIPFPMGQRSYNLMSQLGLGKAGTRYFHPTQLYEIAGTAAVLALAMILGRKWKDGGKFGLFAMGFAALRWILLPLRSFPYPPKIVRIWYPVLYFVLILGGLAFVLHSLPRKHMKKNHSPDK